MYVRTYVRTNLRNRPNGFEYTNIGKKKVETAYFSEKTCSSPISCFYIISLLDRTRFVRTYVCDSFPIKIQIFIARPILRKTYTRTQTRYTSVWGERGKTIPTFFLLLLLFQEVFAEQKADNQTDHISSFFFFPAWLEKSGLKIDEDHDYILEQSNQTPSLLMYTYRWIACMHAGGGLCYYKEDEGERKQIGGGRTKKRLIADQIKNPK